jgi:hypothetical protein
MRDARPVSGVDDAAALRHDYEQRVAALIGRQILAATCWDIHNFGPEPRTWDYGDWQHAVMGVELVTDAGPVTITWTDTFFPYGIEVFDEPISEHLTLGPDGPEGWGVDLHDQWRERTHRTISNASTFWESISVGPGRRNSDGAIVSAAADYDVPVALRLDLGDAPIWFVAGQPGWPDTERVFIAGDEIMVVFSAERMRAIGFPDGDFVAVPKGR